MICVKVIEERRIVFLQYLIEKSEILIFYDNKTMNGSLVSI